MRLIDADSMKADLLTVNPKYETMIDWCIRVLDAQPTVERKTSEWLHELLQDAIDAGIITETQAVRIMERVKA